MPNEQQIEYWNGYAGNIWVAQAEALDAMLAAAGDTVLAIAKLRAGQRIFDIGCGSGAMTRAAQVRVGNESSGGQVTGLDISKPLIVEAQRRAAEENSRATFIEADASKWRSDVEADAIISRFGVMFFDDPAAAFANILKSIKPGGQLTFACWRTPQENDLGSGVVNAVKHLFTPPEVKPDPKAPGPFAFSEPAYVEESLVKGGWRDVQFQKWDGPLPLIGATARDNAEHLTKVGTISRTMKDQGVPAEPVIDALIPFLKQREQGGKFHLIGAAWIVTARR